MFTIKQTKLIILFASCSLFLTACFPSGGQSLSTEDNSVISDEIESIVSNNEHIEVEAELSENITELPMVNVKVMEWDDKKITDTFLSDKENLEHEEADSSIFAEGKRHWYENDDYKFSYQPGFLTSEYRHSSVFGYGSLRTALNFYCYEDIFTNDSISVLPKEEAIKRCTDLLEGAGITNYSEPRVYAITVDKVNEFWIETGYDSSDEYAPWFSPEDEIYVLRFPIEYNGIPVTTFMPEVSSHGMSTFFVGSHIDFVVTKNEVFSLEIFQLFSPEYELGDNVEINCSAENALKIAVEHYDDMFLDYGDKTYIKNNIKILNCELVYIPYEYQDEVDFTSKNFTLTPVWEVSVAAYGDEDIIGERRCFFIDAQTGDILV